jgi:CBS domain-containing protein
MNAADVMVSNVITVNVDVTVQEVASTLATNRVSAMLVLDRQGKLAGIVSEEDLIRRSEIGTERSRSWWLDRLGTNWRLAEEFVRSHSRRVSDVMTTNIISVKPDSTLDEVAILLENNGIKRVPVVQDGTVVGVVSRTNVAQALATVMAQPLERAAENDADEFEQIEEAEEDDEKWDSNKNRASLAQKRDSRGNAKDPERKLLERARMIAVQAELLATHEKEISEVSTAAARNARKDIAEAIRYLQDLEKLLLGQEGLTHDMPVEAAFELGPQAACS